MISDHGCHLLELTVISGHLFEQLFAVKHEPRGLKYGQFSHLAQCCYKLLRNPIVLDKLAFHLLTQVAKGHGFSLHALIRWRQEFSQQFGQVSMQEFALQ